MATISVRLVIGADGDPDCSHRWRPGPSVHFDTRVVDGPVVAGEHSRGVDLGDSSAKSLMVDPYDVRPVRPGKSHGAPAEVTTAVIT
jgi:hypothetical protein